jgi:ESCRT-I complex subunit TSG101
LISKIASALHSRASAAHSQTTSAFSAAAAQREALLRAEAALEREKLELSHQAELCDKDTEILLERIAAAERVIDECRARGPPDVDAVVVAPSVLQNQVYELVTEDMAISDTLYVLGKALDRERISLDVFLKVCFPANIFFFPGKWDISGIDFI